MEIGKRIATIRKQKGLSQKELSEKIGLKSVQGLQKIEYGDFHPKKETLQKIAKVLGVSIIELDDELKETVDRWNQEHDVETLSEEVRIFDKLPPYTEDDIDTFGQFLSLNSDGKQKVSEYIDDLIQSHKYEE